MGGAPSNADARAPVDLVRVLLCPLRPCFVFFLFQIPVTYPNTNPDLCLPELDGKTPKMYRYVPPIVMAIRVAWCCVVMRVGGCSRVS